MRTEYFAARRCGMWSRRTEEMWGIFQREAGPRTALARLVGGPARPKNDGSIFEMGSRVLTRAWETV
jgi:hypothetical protein